MQLVKPKDIVVLFNIFEKTLRQWVSKGCSHHKRITERTTYNIKQVINWYTGFKNSPKRNLPQNYFNWHNNQKITHKIHRGWDTL